MNNIFAYSLSSIFRYGFKNILVICVFGFLVFLISCAIFITSSLKEQYKTISKDFPDILIHSYYGGRLHFVDSRVAEEFWKIPAVEYVEPRIWGSYYFEKEGVYLSLFGIENFQRHFTYSISQTAMNSGALEDDKFMIISKEIREFFKPYIQAYNSVPFFTPDDNLISLKIAGEFRSGSALLDRDVILVSSEIAREILGVPEGKFSDIMLRIANPNEIDFIANKIRLNNPKLKVTTKKEMINSYEFLYDYKSGWFLLLIISSLVTFGIILYDKASGLRSEEKREIGILKALGWDIADIIKFKMIEALVLSLFAFFWGVILAIFYVYILKAPIISWIFAGYSALKINFDLPFVLNFKTLVLLFLLTIPLYVSVSIIPSWKAAIRDVAEVIR